MTTTSTLPSLLRTHHITLEAFIALSISVPESPYYFPIDREIRHPVHLQLERADSIAQHVQKHGMDVSPSSAQTATITTTTAAAPITKTLDQWIREYSMIGATSFGERHENLRKAWGGQEGEDSDRESDDDGPGESFDPNRILAWALGVAEARGDDEEVKGGKDEERNGGAGEKGKVT